jgi:hypothetical protein
MKLRVGDRVTVSPAAFDEQIETVLNPDEILAVVEVNDNAPPGSSGQWVKLKGNIRLRPHSAGMRVRNGAHEWIDSAWCRVVREAAAPPPRAAGEGAASEEPAP